jgi:phosphatidylglycerophosphatase C
VLPTRDWGHHPHELHPCITDAEVAAGFASDVLARHLRPDVVEREAWHRGQGHDVVIVSASFRDCVDPIAAELGVSAVLATELAVGDDERLTGELSGPNVRGAEKVRRLDDWLGDRPAFV